MVTYSQLLNLITDHEDLINKGNNTHAQIDTHVSTSGIHFTQPEISITESQISDFGSYSVTSHLHDDRYYTEAEANNLHGILQGQINTNASDITVLDTKLDTASGTLQDQITTNVSDISTLDTKVDTASGTLQSQITSNDSDIATLQGSMTNHIHDDRYYTESEIDTLSGTLSAEISTSIADLVDTAPETLDTLNELAAALGDDPNFAATVTSGLSNIQTELDNSQASAGLNIDGTYTPDGTATYISTASSLKDADSLLDDQVKTNTDNITAASGTLQTQITANASDIATNISDISQLDTDLSTASGVLNDKITKNITYLSDQTIAGGAGTVGKAYYLTTTADTWLASDKTVEGTVSGRVGVCSDSGTIIFAGTVTSVAHGLGSNGLPLYVNTSGNITATIPNDAGHFIKQVGFIEDVDTINVQIDEDYYELGVVTNASITVLANQAEAEAGTENVNYMSPLRTKQGATHYGHRIGTVKTHTTTAGAITFDLDDGNYHILTATGDITSISIAGNPSGPWGIIIEAINWGAHSITLGSITVPGGSLTLTTAGTDKLVLSGYSGNVSLSLAQEDLQ